MDFAAAGRTWRWEAVDERITGEAAGAVADRAVVYDLAASVAAASADAGVYAFLIHARAARSALRVHQALRSAIRRGADERGQTGADRLAVVIGALTVRAAGGRSAGFTVLLGNYNHARGALQKFTGRFVRIVPPVHRGRRASYLVTYSRQPDTRNLCTGCRCSRGCRCKRGHC